MMIANSTAARRPGMKPARIILCDLGSQYVTWQENVEVTTTGIDGPDRYWGHYFRKDTLGQPEALRQAVVDFAERTKSLLGR